LEQSAERLPRDGVVVAVFDEHHGAEAALAALVREGQPMDRVSLAGRDHRAEEHVIAWEVTGERLRIWGRRGAFWGGVARLLDGAAFLVLPDFGHVLAFGPLAAWVLRDLDGGAVIGGVSALGAGLVSLGVPRAALGPYEAAVHDGRLLLLANGTPAELDRTREWLRRCAPRELHDYGGTAPVPA
jgi:hypothetical protein